MIRVLRLLSAIAMAALLAATVVATASAASPEAGTLVRVELEPRASNGFQAQIESSEKGMVTLELRRKGTLVSYETPGEVSEAGLKVRFGRLGRLDVAFTPTKTLSSTAPSPGCTGQPRTLREGVFSGTIEFSGERDFARLEGPRAAGSMSVISQWDCPGIDEESPLAAFSRLAKPGAAGGKAGKESAWLIAASHSCSCYFSARVNHRHSGGRSLFGGLLEEHSEGMTIQRVTQVTGPASAFDFDLAAGTATLRPPRPLTGRATYEGGSDAPGVWHSTIAVPLPGVDPIRTDGSDFQAILSQPGGDSD